MKNLYALLVMAFSVLISAQEPAGYYSSAQGLTGPALKTELSKIITQGHRDNGYSGLWTAYKTTDIDNFYEKDGTILDIYSENPAGTDPYNYAVGTGQCGNYDSEADCYNREHIVPQSFFNETSPMRNDIHFIRPTDGKVNAIRSNYPFGEVGAVVEGPTRNGSVLGYSLSPGYNGVVFEPIDAFKGDVARMVFYFVTRYESQLKDFDTGNMLGGSAFPGLQKWELDQLLLWSAADPVSPEEIVRNNASYEFQGNRNPFIDHPEFVQAVWGTNGPADTEVPSAPSALAASAPTNSSITLTWTAAADNVGIAMYDIYVNGTFHSSVQGTATAALVSGLTAGTTYSFYVIAKDAAGNSSAQSNTVQGTTANNPPPTGNCGTENFENIPPNNNSYLTRTWTNNRITWTATDARTDQTINGRAITIRNGELSSSNLAGGIGSLTVTTQLIFSGSAANLDVYVNNVLVGKIPYSSTAKTTTLNNINVSGDVSIKLVNPVSGNRVAIDDLSWTCYSGSLGTTDVAKNQFGVYPNPVKDKELHFTGLTGKTDVEIYSQTGQAVMKINGVSNNEKVTLKNVTPGLYLIKAGTKTAKILVQ